MEQFRRFTEKSFASFSVTALSAQMVLEKAASFLSSLGLPLVARFRKSQSVFLRTITATIAIAF